MRGIIVYKEADVLNFISSIKGFDDILEIQKIDKGVSYDLKYKIEFPNSTKLLRIYDLKIKNQVLYKLEKMKTFIPKGC